MKLGGHFQQMERLIAAASAVRSDYLSGELRESSESELTDAISSIHRSSDESSQSLVEEAKRFTDMLIGFEELDSERRFFRLLLIAVCLSGDRCRHPLDPKFLAMAKSGEWLLQIGGGGIEAVRRDSI